MIDDYQEPPEPTPEEEAEARSRAAAGYTSGEYLTAANDWRPCLVGAADEHGNIHIEANGVTHRVPSGNVRRHSEPSSPATPIE